MKKPLRTIVIVAALFSAVSAYSSVPGVQVTVKSKAGGEAVYRGTTDSAGNFTTTPLKPGTYNVEFRSSKAGDLKGKQLSISLSSAKGAAREATAPGNQLQGGVAVEIQVAAASKLTGRITAGGAAAKTIAAVPAGMEKVKGNVKIINGKRYVWVPGSIGSNMGGKWVEEGSDGAALSTSNKKGGDAEVLRRIQDRSGDVGTRWDGFGSPGGPGP